MILQKYLAAAPERLSQVFPAPKQIQLKKGQECRIPSSPAIQLEFAEEKLRHTAKVIAVELKKNIPGARTSCRRSSGRKFNGLRLVLKCELQHEKKEAYSLTMDRNFVEFNAASEAGLICALATFLQLLYKDSCYIGSYPAGQIVDYPDIEYRTCGRWMVDIEANRWAFDWGDGREAVLARYRRMIDYAMRYKINSVRFEGYIWNRNKYPGYAKDMREINRYAIDRNVRLAYGGHGIGIGGRNPKFTEVCMCGFHKGLGDINRRSYPGGEPYMCMGDAEDHPTRYNGTCRSNEALNRLKAADLADFVRKIEPRSISIHHEDVGCAQLEINWSLRCPECRKRWPGGLCDADGCAGAVAYGMNVLIDAIFSVKKKGYDGSKDCLIGMIPPFYGGTEGYEQEDGEWKKLQRYLGTIESLLRRSPNVCLCIREELRSPLDNSRRMPVLVDLLRKNYPRKINTSFVTGGENYFSDALFTATALMNCYAREVNTIFDMGGGLFHEAQEVFEAECCWNIPNDMYTTAKEADAGFLKLGIKHWIPDEITGENGFLTRFCRSFFGAKSGPIMRDIYLLGGPLPPKRKADGTTYTPGYCYPMATFFYRFEKDKLFKLTRNLADYNIPDCRLKWQGIRRLTLEALEMAKQADHLAGNCAGRETLHYFTKCLELGSYFAAAIEAIFAEKPDWKNVSLLIDRTEAFMKRNFQFNFVSEYDGEGARWPGYIDRLREVVKLNSSSGSITEKKHK